MKCLVSCEIIQLRCVEIAIQRMHLQREQFIDLIEQAGENPSSR